MWIFLRFLFDVILFIFHTCRSFIKKQKKHKNYLKFPDEIRRCSNNNNNIVGNVLEFQLQYSDGTLPFDVFKKQNLKVEEYTAASPCNVVVVVAYTIKCCRYAIKKYLFFLKKKKKSRPPLCRFFFHQEKRKPGGIIWVI